MGKPKQGYIISKGTHSNCSQLYLAGTGWWLCIFVQ